MEPVTAEHPAAGDDDNFDAHVERVVQRAILRNIPGLNLPQSQSELDVGQTPKELVYSNETARLYHYTPMLDEIYRVPVLIDGFISTAGALIAAGLAPLSRDYMIAAHRSVEPGHQIMQKHLDLQPIFHLDLRLGEGTGAALAMPVVASAVATLNQMATFSDANVSGKL